MNTFLKTSIATGLTAAVALVGTNNAQAHGWPIVASVVGGVAVGTAIGASIAAAHAPVYVYPGYSYPVYQPAVAPVVQTVAAPPAVYVSAAAPVYCAPSPVVYGGGYWWGRPSYYRYGWGGRYYYGHRR